MFLRSLSILIYHRVLAKPDDLLPDLVCIEDFERQLALLRRWFNVLSLREGLARLREGALPPRAVCVTFDDGYADNAEIALPALLAHGVPATFFVATSFLDGGRMWNDTVIETVRAARGDVLNARAAGLGQVDISSLPLRRAALERLIHALKYEPVEERQQRVDRLASENDVELSCRLMMTADQVRKLHANRMEIGGHTANHPILARLNDASALDEIRLGRERLEAIIDAPVRLFAYPNGKPGQDYRKQHVAMVRDLGFDAAVSTAWGVSHSGSDLHQLPRFTPWDKRPEKFVLRLFMNMLRTRPQIA